MPIALRATLLLGVLCFTSDLVRRPEWRQRASLCLVAAGFLLPAGFLLGGVVTYPGDPGPGILLVPVGAVLFFAAVLLTALSVGDGQPR